MIYENIKSLCSRRNISIRKLERELGFHNATIGCWRKSTPAVDKINAVAKYFGVSLDELVNARQSPAPSRETAKGDPLSEKERALAAEYLDEVMGLPPETQRDLLLMIYSGIAMFKVSQKSA